MKDFELRGDGTGFWDSYEKEITWLGESVAVSIAARSLSDDIPVLLDTMLGNQGTFDREWKKFAAGELLSRLQSEWRRAELDESDVIDDLMVSRLTFGFDADAFFCVWFSTKTVSNEHGVQVYGDRHAKPIRAAIE